MVLVSADTVSALLKALGLTSSLFKPIPGLVGAIDGIVHPIVAGLPVLGPILGNILEAEDPSSSGAAGSSSVSRAQVFDVVNQCNVEPYDPPPVLAQTFPPFDQAKANVFRYRQQQSVNMGSWFVHEQWMTPSLFTCASGPQMAEIDIASGWGNTSAARAVLEHHWDTFVNQSDFEYLSAIGINTVRLPIGYWNLGPVYCQGTPFESVADVYTNSWSRVVRAINWAGEAGMGVLLDLHGAPGSQNGQAHSGVSDGQTNFFNTTNMDKTIEILTFLVQQFASVTNVVGIEVLNEPNDDPQLSDFYTRAITTMRQVSPEAANLPIYIHDAFNMDQYSDFVAKRTDFIVEDHHSYFVFTPEDEARTGDEETKQVENTVSQQLSTASQNARRNLVVGEWSCALDPDSLKNASDPLQTRQQFCQGQEQVYSNTTAGWHFWSYMKEGCDTDLDWCFKSAVGNTLQATFFSYNTTSSTPSQSQSLARAVAEMELPSMMEVLGLSDTQSSSTSTSTVTSSATTTNISTTTETASAATVTMACVSSNSTSMSCQDISKRSIHAHHRRFSAIHSRRTTLAGLKRHRRDSSYSSSSTSSSSSSTTTTSAPSSTPSNLTAAETSITKGYSDGFLTGKIFAQYGLSKLGFVKQYIADSIAALGPSIIAPGTEDYYSAWFIRGLGDAQELIGAAAGQGQ